MTAQQSPPGPVRAYGPLAESIIALAQTPDDASTLDAQLVTIAQLAVDRVAAVSYASVTALRAGGYTTVAASGEIARAVDEVQYAEQAGPCIETVENAAPVAVPDIAAVMAWPGFRQAAIKMGLRASLSIPLTAGSGAPGAALNLYGRDEAAMAAVTRGIYAAFGITAPPAAGPEPGVLDTGGQELIAGVTGRSPCAPPSNRPSESSWPSRATPQERHTCSYGSVPPKPGRPYATPRTP